jgi:hypothetical protein
VTTVVSGYGCWPMPSLAMALKAARRFDKRIGERRYFKEPLV